MPPSCRLPPAAAGLSGHSHTHPFTHCTHACAHTLLNDQCGSRQQFVTVGATTLLADAQTLQVHVRTLLFPALATPLRLLPPATSLPPNTQGAHNQAASAPLLAAAPDPLFWASLHYCSMKQTTAGSETAAHGPGMHAPLLPFALLCLHGPALPANCYPVPHNTSTTQPHARLVRLSPPLHAHQSHQRTTDTHVLLLPLLLLLSRCVDP